MGKSLDKVYNDLHKMGGGKLYYISARKTKVNFRKD